MDHRTYKQFSQTLGDLAIILKIFLGPAVVLFFDDHKHWAAGKGIEDKVTEHLFDENRDDRGGSGWHRH